MLDQPDVPDDPQEIVRRLFSDDAKRHPHAYYDKLRELAPVFRDADSGMWYLSSWEACNTVLRSDRFGQGGRTSQDPRYATSSALKMLGENLTGMDPPEHSRLRFFISRGLSRAVVEGMRGYVASVTEAALDEMEDQDEFDLVSSYAARIPGTVICELLGIPRADHVLFDKWLADQFRILAPHPPSDELLAEVDATIDALEAYVGGVIEERRREPRQDLISSFIAAESDAEKQMTAREVVVMTNILLGGGSDTTKTVIAMGTRALLQNPGQMARLRDDPSMDNRAFEELVRMAGPVLIANPRMSFDGAVIGGQTIGKGELAASLLMGANFDPKVFQDPLALELGRSPNPHLAFGHGAHICVGNMLARVVAMHAIGALIRRFPTLELAEDEMDPRLDLFALRGLKSLRVRKG